MGLFKSNYNKPGPGVPKNAPKKKGFSRFLEILSRDLGNLVKLNILLQLCYLPAQVCFLLAFYNLISGQGQNFILFGLLALVASFPVGAARTAESHLMGKIMRDEPGFLWHDFKKTFKENFVHQIVPGMLYALILGSQVLAVVYYTAGASSISVVWVAAFIASVVLFSMAAPYFFMQAAYLELGFGARLKNSFLLALGNAPRSLAGGLICLALGVAQVLLFPYAVPVTLLIGYALPTLVNVMWVWPMLDKTFKIDETLKARNQQSLDEALAEE
ncbi:MAG: hypothetical protein ACK5L3_07585 [Oscillospiraceae bacterium]